MSNHKRGSYQKRRKGVEKETPKVSAEENDSPIVALFRSYQVELDARYDKYERLVKKSRDLTIESKRIIFLMHRVTGTEKDEEILEEARNRLCILHSSVVNEIALELKKREVYQFIRAFTCGLQEYVEAVSFYHYLRNGNVISLEEVHNIELISVSSEMIPVKLKADLPLSDLLTPVEYILGIADLTGELMRKCINSVGTGNIEEPFKLCALLQNIYEAMLVCGNSSRDLKRKLITLRSSVQKVENACYAIRIRGSETPKHMLADLFSTEEPEAIDI